MKHISSSVWISIVILTLIPASWFVQFFLNKAMLAYVVELVGKEEIVNSFDDFKMLFLVIPISQLVSLATIVIPAIFIRKAVREGTTNLRMPVGKNGRHKVEHENTNKGTTTSEKQSGEPSAL